MTQAERSPRPIHFGLVLLGLLFFCNPYFAVVDVLPDLIGCLLVYVGLSRVSHFSHQMREARIAFLKLLGFCAIKDVLVMVIFGMSTDLERPVSLLAIAFVQAVVGLYLSFSALDALFDGFHALAITHSCSALYGKFRRKGLFGHPPSERSRTEVILRYSKIFFVVREAICLLPEFAALTTSSYLDSEMIRLYDYIGVMRLLAFIAVLVVAVLWVIYLCRYFAVVRREQAFCEALSKKEAEYVAAHPGDRIIARYGLCFLFLAIGAFLTADFYLDFQNIIPDALAALCFLISVLLMDLSRAQKLLGSCLALGYGAFATLSAVFAYRFAMHHSAGEISKTDEAASAYLKMWGTALLEFLVFLSFLVVLLMLLRQIIRKWAGYLPKYDDLEFEQRRRQAFLDEFDGTLIRTFVFGFISALCSFLYDYIKEIPNHRIFRILELFWALDLAMALAFAVSVSFLLVNIREQIKHRFLYDG